MPAKPRVAKTDHAAAEGLSEPLVARSSLVYAALPSFLPFLYVAGRSCPSSVVAARLTARLALAQSLTRPAAGKLALRSSPHWPRPLP